MKTSGDQDELRDAPILRSLRREDPFATPPQFFDRLPALVQQRIVAEGTASEFRWKRLRIPAAAFAFAVTVMVALIWWPTPPQTPLPDALVEEGSASHYLEAFEPDELDLLAAYGDDPALYTEIGHGIGSDELTAYLLNEDLALDQLIEEL